MLAGETLLDYTYLLSRSHSKKNEYIYIYSIFKINMPEEKILKFRLRKIDEIRNYLSEEIKHNDLMSEKYKQTC